MLTNLPLPDWLIGILYLNVEVLHFFMQALIVCNNNQGNAWHETALGTGFKVYNLSLWYGVKSQGFFVSLLFPVVAASLHCDLFSCYRLCSAKPFHGVPLRFLAPQPQLREPGAWRWDWRRPDSVVYGCWKIQPKRIYINTCRCLLNTFLCTRIRYN